MSAPSMDFDKLRDALPKVGESLVKMLIEDGLEAFEKVGATLDDADIIVSLDLVTVSNGNLRVSLKLERGGNSDEGDDDGDEE